MGWTTVYTFTAGEMIDASIMNTYLRDNLLYFKSGGDGWVSPTGYVDGDSAWEDEGNAYDGDIETSARALTGIQSWSSFLELTIGKLSCNKVRVMSSILLTTGYINEIDLDVYYNSAWHNIYEGVFTGSEWTEYELDDTYNVTSLRIRLRSSHSLARIAAIWEVEFNHVSSSIENDLTVASLTTAGLVDGVDLSIHASGQVVSQHLAGMGNHTHYSTEEQGNTLSVTAVVSTNRISLAQMPAGDYGLFFRGTGSTSPVYNNN